MDRWWGHSTMKRAGRRQWLEDKGELGRGAWKRVRANRTTMATMWAEDGEGEGNNNARSSLPALFLAILRSIVKVCLTRRVCSQVLAAFAAPWATGLGGSRSSLLFSDGEGATKELVRARGSGVGLDM